MSDRSRMLPHGLGGWLGLAVATGGIAVLPFLVSGYYVGLATKAMIGAMLALSLHLLVGGTGLVSLGHGAFFGLAAYVVYLVSPEGQPQAIWLTLPLAMAASGVAALAVGALSLRTTGFFFLMVTLAFGQMIFFVFHDTKLGGGTDGAYLGKPLLTLFGLTLDPTSLPRSQRTWPAFYVALVQLAVMYLGLAWLLRSMFGRALEGIRVNEHRMAAIGFNTYRYKLAAFTIAGTLAGAAGHMWSLQTGFVNPELVGWHKSAEALLMILLGGIGSLAGAIVGAFALTALGEIAQLAGGSIVTLAASFGDTALGRALRSVGVVLGERKLLIEGVVVLLTVLCFRSGLAGTFSRSREDAGSDGGDAAQRADLLRQSLHGDVRSQAEGVGGQHHE